MLRLGRTRPEIRVVKDQFGTPTFANDLASAITQIINCYAGSRIWTKKAGVYNYCNVGVTNWSEIAEHVIKRAELSCRIKPIRSVDYPTAAPRPRYSVLDLAKFKRNFDIPTLPWQERLDVCLTAIINEST